MDGTYYSDAAARELNHSKSSSRTFQRGLDLQCKVIQHSTRNVKNGMQGIQSTPDRSTGQHEQATSVKATSCLWAFGLKQSATSSQPCSQTRANIKQLAERKVSLAWQAHKLTIRPVKLFTPFQLFLGPRSHVLSHNLHEKRAGQVPESRFAWRSWSVSSYSTTSSARCLSHGAGKVHSKEHASCTPKNSLFKEKNIAQQCQTCLPRAV